ncbi:MAG: SDR family NAD(P)-dependent oxidoreductase [Myxococcota bacterium]
MPNTRLSPAPWVITGGASGFGRAFAHRLTRQGASVSLWDRDAEALRAVRDELGVAGHDEVLDVRDEEAVLSAAERTAAALGSVGHVIACAGILRVGDALDVGPDARRSMMDINFHGSVSTAHALVPHLRAASGRSVVLFVGSVAGMRGFPGLAAYGASKFAVIGYAQALRAELHGSGVDVRVLCPPAGDTPMVRNIEKMPPVYRLSALVSAETVVDAAMAGMQGNEWRILVDARSKVVSAVDRAVPGIVDRVVGWASKT